MVSINTSISKFCASSLIIYKHYLLNSLLDNVYSILDLSYELFFIKFIFDILIREEICM